MVTPQQRLWGIENLININYSMRSENQIMSPWNIPGGNYGGTNMLHDSIKGR